MTPARHAPGMRRAALALHAASPADRDWLLAQIPEHQRAALVELVGELEKLGFAADRSVLRQALAAPRERAREDAASRLQRADPRALAEVLAEEPALIGRMVRAGHSEGVMPPRLDRCVREQVAARLPEPGLPVRGIRALLGRIRPSRGVKAA